MNNKINQLINNRRLKTYKKTLDEINQFNEQYKHLANEELQEKTVEFRTLLQQGTTLDEILPEAYAVVREASARVLGMYPKDVQVLGGIILHQGDIIEMQTGEGKTLTATLPLYLHGLLGNGVFLVTTNDYLAKRDFLETQPLYEWLGLTISLGFKESSDTYIKNDMKKEIYSADIIYTTNGRLGFDYLMDNLADSIEGKFMPKLTYCIIDEVDSIILDSSQTPLVISGAPRVQSNLFNICNEFVSTLQQNKDFKIDFIRKQAWLTEEGAYSAELYFGIQNLYSEEYTPLLRNIALALQANYLFENNKDYYVMNGKIILIDRITGRLLPGTKLQSGLHQALEAKEYLDVSDDLSVMATITFQNLFREFDLFSGMSGTVKLGENEFVNLYKKIVIQIPTDKKINRIDYADQVFITEKQKNFTLINDIIKRHQTGQPVLLITRTADTAHYFSRELFSRNIPNNLLTAQNIAKEAQMIAEAGQTGVVTVATSLAGRGTDIKLDEKSRELGGLAVIVSEHMENSRVDLQLRGRAGRQGDPGESQFYISLDDYLVTKWSDSSILFNEKLKNINQNIFENSYLLKNKIKKVVKKAQQISEEHSYTSRELANEFAHSMRIQRNLVYNERNKVLYHQNLKSFNFYSLAEEVFRLYAQNDRLNGWQSLNQYIYSNVSYEIDDEININFFQDDDIVKLLLSIFDNQMQRQQSSISNPYFYDQYLKKIMLKSIDAAWIEQVDFLQQLKTSISDRQNGQRHIIFEYHRVALESYYHMKKEIKKNIIKNLCLSIVTYDKDDNMIIHFPVG